MGREQTVRRERESFSGDSHDEAEESQPTESRDDAEVCKDFLSVHGDFIYRHHIEPRVKLYVLKEETFPIPLKYFDVMRSTNTDLDIAQEKRNDIIGMLMKMEDCQIQWTGFPKFTLLKETPPKRHMWSGMRLPKNQTTTRQDHLWPEAWSRIGKAAPKREQQEWAIEKPKVNTARNSRGNYSIDPDDEEYKDIIKIARRKSERHMAAAMPCKRKPRSTSSRETGALIRTKANASEKIQKTKIELYCGSSGIHKTKNGICYEEKS